MSDSKMEVDEAVLNDIEKEGKNIKNLLDKANETIKAVREKNKNDVDAAKEKARLDLVKPFEARKAALLYRRALKAKKRHLGIEPEPEKASKVKFYIHIRFLYTLTCLINEHACLTFREFLPTLHTLFWICSNV